MDCVGKEYDIKQDSDKIRFGSLAAFDKDGNATGTLIPLRRNSVIKIIRRDQDSGDIFGTPGTPMYFIQVDDNIDTFTIEGVDMVHSLIKDGHLIEKPEVGIRGYYRGHEYGRNPFEWL